MPEPPFCRVHLYEHWEDVVRLLRRELSGADVAMVGSFFPDGVSAVAEILESNVAVKSFYDIDTPITLSRLRVGDAQYLRRDQIPGFDVYFSFTGGGALAELEKQFGAQRTVPLYCSFDPERYRSLQPDLRYECDLSYMGTYAPDRQEKLAELFCGTALALPEKQFVLAGPQYPAKLVWPRNIRRIVHLEPEFHPHFYSSSLFTLNLTRKEMVEAGHSPSVRLFEAAGCGSAIISDSWTGIESFFEPNREIVLAHSREDVISFLTSLSPDEARLIGRQAQERVLTEHTSAQRAIEFEDAVSSRTPELANKL